jgi:hypothetical protein
MFYYILYVILKQLKLCIFITSDMNKYDYNNFKYIYRQNFVTLNHYFV